MKKNQEQIVGFFRERAKQDLKNDLLYSIQGVRGRHLYVYPSKCIIKTSVTPGSVLTQNITDGEKTIYYTDVIGLQFKPVTLTIGYLQFETASSLMNNSSNNFFNENTFTFDGAQADVKTQEAYEFIIGVLDYIKSVKIEDYYEQVVSMEKQKALEEDEIKKQQERIRAERIQEEIRKHQSDDGQFNVDDYIIKLDSIESTKEMFEDVVVLSEVLPQLFDESIIEELRKISAREKLYGKGYGHKDFMDSIRRYLGQ